MFLTVKDLKKSYGSGSTKVEVLKGINFEVMKGEICVLLGPSGSGKSTLLNIIGGIDDADSGYVSINNEKTKDMKENIHHCLIILHKTNNKQTIRQKNKKSDLQAAIIGVK